MALPPPWRRDFCIGSTLVRSSIARCGFCGGWSFTAALPAPTLWLVFIDALELVVVRVAAMRWLVLIAARCEQRGYVLRHEEKRAPQRTQRRKRTSRSQTRHWHRHNGRQPG